MCRFALTLAPGSHVVGFGERFDRVDQAGRRPDAVVFEQYKAQGGRTYLPMPFAIVVPPGVPGDTAGDETGEAGWGFHVRTGARTWYDVGATQPDRLAVEVALDSTAAADLTVAALPAGPPRRAPGVPGRDRRAGRAARLDVPAVDYAATSGTPRRASARRSSAAWMRAFRSVSS